MIRPGRHIILDDREEGRVFTGDIVKVYTDRGVQACRRGEKVFVRRAEDKKSAQPLAEG